MVDMETLGERLRKEREAQKMTQGDLGKVAGVSKQAIAKIESGATQEPATTTLEPIARHLGVNLRWLTEGRGEKRLQAPMADEWPDVMAYRTSASLGDGSEPDEWMETHKLKFRAESLQRKRLRAEHLGVVFGRGDSMLPRIRSGDAIMFDKRKTTATDGDLFVITYDGGLLAKKLTNLGGRWFIESLNKDDPKWRKPVPVEDHKGFAIHGKVVWIGSWEE
jgi:phage repressor protein C with HTH and peptisase S24 domain